MENNYEIIVTPLSEEDGGGFVAIVPDLQGCMSDGETPVEAIEEVLDAIAVWAKAQKAKNQEMPEPGWLYRDATERHAELVQLLKDQAEEIERLVSENEQLRRSPGRRVFYGGGGAVLRTDIVSGRVWSGAPRTKKEAIIASGS